MSTINLLARNCTLFPTTKALDEDAYREPPQRFVDFKVGPSSPAAARVAEIDELAQAAGLGQQGKVRAVNDRDNAGQQQAKRRCWTVGFVAGLASLLSDKNDKRSLLRLTEMHPKPIWGIKNLKESGLNDVPSHILRWQPLAIRTIVIREVREPHKSFATTPGDYVP